MDDFIDYTYPPQLKEGSLLTDGLEIGLGLKELKKVLTWVDGMSCQVQMFLHGPGKPLVLSCTMEGVVMEALLATIPAAEWPLDDIQSQRSNDSFSETEPLHSASSFSNASLKHPMAFDEIIPESPRNELSDDETVGIFNQLKRQKY